MYANHFGLRCLPFEDRADAQFFFATPEREETLAAMEYEAHFGHGILVVEADAGMGKTLLIRTLAGRLQASDLPVILQWQAGGERSLIRECCKGFGVSIPSSGGADRAIARLGRHLARTAKAEHHSLLIVDQAENLSSANLGELALLAEIEGPSGKLLPIILVGQPKLVSILHDSKEETLKQYTREVRRICSLSPSETAAYIEHRLAVAGVAECGTFAADATTAIHEASSGVPRLINRISHDALVAAYGAGKVCVDGAMISEVARSSSAVTRSIPASEVGLRGVEQVAAGAQVAVGCSAGMGSGAREVGMGAEASAPSIGTAIEYGNDPKPPAYAYGRDIESPPAFEDADEFYDRLAQTVSRGERATASTEVTLAKAGAVGQHLEALLGRAEAVISALGGSVQEGDSLTDHIKRRLNEIASETERRVEAMESRALRAGTVAADVEEQIQRIELACSRAEGIERRLSTEAGQIADKADEVQRQVATISETVAGSEDARGDMERLIAHASAITGAAEEKLAVMRGAVTSAIEEATSKSATVEERFATQVSMMTGVAEEKLAAVRGSMKSTLEEVSSESAKAEQRLATGVSRMTGAAEEKLAAVRSAATSAIEEAAIKSAKVEERFATQVSLMTGTAEEKLAAVRSAATSAIDEAAIKSAKVEERLATQVSLMTGTAEEKISAVRSAATSAIDEVVSESAKVEQRLATQVSRMTRDAEEKLAVICGSAKSTLEEVTSESEKAEQRTVSIRSKLAVTLEKAEGVERELGDRMLARCRAKIETELEGIEKERKARLESLLDGYRKESDSAYKTQQDRFAKFAQELDARSERAIEDARGRTLGAIVKLAGRIDELSKNVEAVETRQTKVSAAQRDVATTIGKTETTVSVLSDRVCELDGRVLSAKSSVEKLVSTASTVTDPLGESIALAEALIGESGSVSENLESMLDKVGSALIQTGRACEQAEVARAKASQCEIIIARFDEDTEAGRAIAERLETLVPTGKASAEELAHASCEATDVSIRLTSQNHDAVMTAEQLQRGVTQGQEAIDRITAAAITAEQAVESVQTTSDNLQDRHESAGQLVTELDSLNTTARQLHDALQGVVAHADEKTGRLGSHSAAASKILKQLAEANIDSHSALKQSMEMQRKIETLTKDVWSLTSKSENCAKALTTKAETAGRIVAKIDAATKQVQPIVSDLSLHVQKAIEFEKRLASETTKAGDIVERLDCITVVLKQANELNDVVGKTVDDARAISAELSATMEQILPQYQQMQDAYAAAQGLIETSTQLKSESDAAAERFIENLQASQQVIEDVQTQAESLGRQMQKAKKDGDRVEQHIEALMIQPKKLLEQAQSQSTQLERVCDAVRKVFANLSKTSLEAKERTGELQAVERHATARLEQLIGETGATTQMLNQWVQEAINAQARLQQTVERIPSIRDTHPSDRLQRLSALGQPVTRIANRSAHPAIRATEPTAAETARLVKAASESKSTVAPAGGAPVTASSPRAAEIARMIEEAKKSEVTV